MPDLKGLENVQLVIAFIVPGLIISYVRARFVNGRMDKPSDAVLTYLSLAVVYYGLALPLLYYIVDLPTGLLRNLCWWALIAVGPAFFGLLLGIGTQRGWIRGLAHKLGLQPIHTVPVAWDWRFGACRGSCFVLVTLANGDTVAGIFGTGSFASSDPAERDIYLEELWDIPDDGGAWTPRNNRQGILLPAKEIRHVQFWS
jgi:hypothetical protein